MTSPSRSGQVADFNRRINFPMIDSTSDLRATDGIGASRDAVAAVPTSRYARYFFVGMGVLFFVINALGFVPQLVSIHAQKIQLHWFTHVHGAVMTGWLSLFLLQALLAAKGQLKYHRRLGIFSVGWGAIVWVTSIIVVLSASVRENPPEESGFAIQALGLAALALFGLFFTWGI